MKLRAKNSLGKVDPDNDFETLIMNMIAKLSWKIKICYL